MFFFSICFATKNDRNNNKSDYPEKYNKPTPNALSFIFHYSFVLDMGYRDTNNENLFYTT